jgi:NAD(P)-dependent dehydrogenase (short-subunit alcohol dehydrogenase family)
VIIGGNSRIGPVTAKQFVNEGAYVFITGCREREWDEVVREIGKNMSATNFLISITFLRPIIRASDTATGQIRKSSRTRSITGYHHWT